MQNVNFNPNVKIKPVQAPHAGFPPSTAAPSRRARTRITTAWCGA